MFYGIRHWLRHRLNLQPTKVTTAWFGREQWEGDRCTICGQISNWRAIGYQAIVYHPLNDIVHDGAKFDDVGNSISLDPGDDHFPQLDSDRK